MRGNKVGEMKTEKLNPCSKLKFALYNSLYTVIPIKTNQHILDILTGASIICNHEGTQAAFTSNCYIQKHVLTRPHGFSLTEPSILDKDILTGRRSKRETRHSCITGAKVAKCEINACVQSSVWPSRPHKVKFPCVLHSVATIQT